jgi:hypothetical protein
MALFIGARNIVSGFGWGPVYESVTTQPNLRKQPYRIPCGAVWGGIQPASLHACTKPALLEAQGDRQLASLRDTLVKGGTAFSGGPLLDDCTFMVIEIQ